MYSGVPQSVPPPVGHIFWLGRSRPDSEGGHLKNISCPPIVMSGRGSSARMWGDIFLGQADVSGGGTSQVVGGTLCGTPLYLEEGCMVIIII